MRLSLGVQRYKKTTCGQHVRVSAGIRRQGEISRDSIVVRILACTLYVDHIKKHDIYCRVTSLLPADQRIVNIIYFLHYGLVSTGRIIGLGRFVFGLYPCAT